jgi:hypothetical protein
LSNTEYIPHDISSEKALLGSLLIFPNAIDEVMEIITKADFYIYRHQVIFDAICHLREMKIPVDIITLIGRLRAEGNLSEIGGEPYLLELENSCPSSTNYRSYSTLVKEAAINRRIVELATTIVQNAVSGISSTINVHFLEDFLADSQNFIRLNRRILMTASELCSKDVPGLTWLADQWIVKSALNLIAGAPATGKTFITIDFALGLSLGGLAWGNFQLEKSRVLYHYLDGSLSGMHSRVKKMLAGRNVESPENLFFDFSKLDLRSSSDITLLKKQIQQLKISVVVFDVFAKFIPGADENSVSDIAPVMNSLREIANSLGTTFILLHHLNKGTGFDYGNRVRGSSEILGSVDTALIVTQTNSGGQNTKRQIIAQKIRDADTPSPLQFSIKSSEERILLEFEENTEANDFYIGQRDVILQKMLDILKDTPGKEFSRAELIELIQIDASDRTYSRAFQLLNYDSEVLKSKDGTRNLYSWITNMPTTPLL